MSTRIPRRQILSGAVAGVAALAFDPVTRSWAGDAAAAGLRVPGLAGELLLDAESLREAGDDFGHIIHHAPTAVLRPASIDDIQAMVVFANAHGLHITMRGSGHSAFGQAQARAGVIIDSSTLAEIHEVGADAVVVDAGARWSDVVRATLPQGLLPPVLPDSLALSVGGVLACGGVGPASHRRGLVADHVRALDVVTGDGRRVRCSSRASPELFHAALGGFGRHVIIVRATLSLTRATESVRVHTATYDSLGDALDTLDALSGDERFETIRAMITSAPERGWACSLQATEHRDPGERPDLDAREIFGETALDVSFFDCRQQEWVERLDATVEYFKSVELWDVPHPRLDLFLPTEAAGPFVLDLLDDLEAEETADYPIMLTPIRRDERSSAMSGFPDTPGLAFSLLRFARSEQGDAEAMVLSNRALYERAARMGGKSFAISAVPFTQADWIDHHGSDYPIEIQRKATLDPGAVLGSSFGLFSRT